MKTNKKQIGKKQRGIAERFLGGLPVLGDLVKELGKTETFKKRFEEVDEQIKENLRKGGKKKWSFEAHIGVRPIIGDLKKEESELVIKEDYLYGKKPNHLTLAVKVPSQNVQIDFRDSRLKLKTNNWEKTIDLPERYTVLRRERYEKGILVLELSK